MNDQRSKTLKKVLQSLSLIVIVLLFSTCAKEPEVSFADSFADVDGAKRVQLEYKAYDPPKDVPSQSQDAPITELAKFAWQEFVALNWPADPESRGFADKSQTNGFITASKVGGPTYTPVWQTYWHRNELFPATGKTPVVPKKNDASKPIYQYSSTYEFGGSSGQGKYDLWNNLDEVNELDQDIVFAHSSSSTLNSEYQVLYEAKMNYDGSRYVYDNGLQDATTRANKKSNTAGSPQNQGVCKAESGEYICLPCGELDEGGIEGNIEIKAAWRKLTDKELQSSSYHTQEVIYYKNVSQPGGGLKTYYENATMGLVGLHIIHKTKTFPTYVFATFEHKDNLSSGIVYTELENTNFGDKQSKKGEYTPIERKHPIPEVIDIINGIVEIDLAAQNSVWQNYKLINVQAKPNDKNDLKGSRTDAKNSYFYLSNSVIESNIELQTFTGTLIDSVPKNVTYQDTSNQPKLVNMGGCMGCHGNAQQKGTDFNFLIDNAPFSNAETTGPQFGCPPGAKATSIQNWEDVKAFFDNCKKALHVSISGSPHNNFWENRPVKPDYTQRQKDSVNHHFFTNGMVPNIPFQVRICVPKKPSESGIITYLSGTGAAKNTHMPGQGPYYSPAQIDSLAAWIKRGAKFE